MIQSVGVKPAAGLAAAGERAAQHPQQFLTFLLGGETFAVGILGIKEIIEYGSPTAVPMMPAYIRGVINLRGAVVPVVDMQARIGRQSCDVTKRTCIVIVELKSSEESQDVGIVVDQVNEVVEIAAADIEPAPSFGAGIRSDFIQGIGKIAGRFVIVLNTNRLLSIDELAGIDGGDALAVEEPAA